QPRREILHPHRERVVQGGLPQERWRDGQLLELPHRERRLGGQHAARYWEPGEFLWVVRREHPWERWLHDRQPFLPPQRRRICELRESLRHVRSGRQRLGVE